MGLDSGRHRSLGVTGGQVPERAESFSGSVVLLSAQIARSVFRSGQANSLDCHLKEVFVLLLRVFQKATVRGCRDLPLVVSSYRAHASCKSDSSGRAYSQARGKHAFLGKSSRQFPEKQFAVNLGRCEESLVKFLKSVDPLHTQFGRSAKPDLSPRLKQAWPRCGYLGLGRVKVSDTYFPSGFIAP